MGREVVFTVSADGKEVKAEALGFKGKGCEKIIGPVMEALGRTDTKKKPEYNLTDSQSVRA
jgi:hypothetical protein